jgi:DNA polymerase phi
MLIEAILGLLSKPSALLRKLSGQVFESFAGDVTSAGLKLLLDVLLTPETASGATDLFDNLEDEDANSDLAEISQGDKDGEDGEESAEDDEMDIDEDDDADEGLNAALSEALGVTTQVNGKGAEGDSSDEELMNDEEMLALDDNLASIFRQRLKPSRAKEAKETKLQMSTFKSKVIDLLEILVKSRSDLHLEIILPLLRALHITKDETVRSKTFELLHKLAKSKEIPDPTDNLMGILRKIHEDAAKAKGKDGNIHSQLSIYIARIARKGGQEEEVIGVYAETMRKWIKNGKSMVKAGLFADWVNWCQSIRR